MAIEDPRQRAEYIRAMANLAGSSEKPDLRNAFANIREDIALVTDPNVRKQANELLRQAVGSIYLLERNLGDYPKALASALDNLADYLEKNDK